MPTDGFTVNMSPGVTLAAARKRYVERRYLREVAPGVARSVRRAVNSSDVARALEYV